MYQKKTKLSNGLEPHAPSRGSHMDLSSIQTLVLRFVFGEGAIGVSTLLFDPQYTRLRDTKCKLVPAAKRVHAKTEIYPRTKFGCWFGISLANSSE